MVSTGPFSWWQSEGDLVATAPDSKAEMNATGYGDCILCTINTIVRTQGGLFSRTFIQAWRQDRNNQVQLVLKEETDTWILKQRVNGTVVAKQKGQFRIDPDVACSVSISFDGFYFHVTKIITMAAGGLSGGTVGYKVKNTIDRFAFLCV